jgi:hypothetical protein
LAKQKAPSPQTPFTQQIQKTLKCPSARKTLKNGENGEREDPIVSPIVSPAEDKLFPKDLSNATPYPYYTHRRNTTQNKYTICIRRS